MLDALLSLWPLWSFAILGVLLVKVVRVWFFYRRRLKRM